MMRIRNRKSLPVGILLGALVMFCSVEPAWAILGVWRRAARRTVVVASAATAGAAVAAEATASASASKEAAAAQSAQAAAAASAASAAAASQAAAAASQAAAHPPAPAAAPAPAAPAQTPQQKLEELQSMLKQGLISETDYEAAKAKILAEMTK